MDISIVVLVILSVLLLFILSVILFDSLKPRKNGLLEHLKGRFGVTKNLSTGENILVGISSPSNNQSEPLRAIEPNNHNNFYTSDTNQKRRKRNSRTRRIPNRRYIKKSSTRLLNLVRQRRDQHNR